MLTDYIISKRDMATTQNENGAKKPAGIPPACKRYFSFGS